MKYVSQKQKTYIFFIKETKVDKTVVKKDDM